MPLPLSAGALRASAALGAALAALLDPDRPVPGLTTGALRPELAAIAVPITRPDRHRDWALQNWGNRTDKGVTMPLRGRVDLRPYAEGERDTAAHAPVLGECASDIGMNGASAWRCVPERVWECRIGGYQMLKKWLSYRDQSVIGRALTADEVRHFQQAARRIAAILLLGPELDASHRRCANPAA